MFESLGLAVRVLLGEMQQICSRFGRKDGSKEQKSLEEARRKGRQGPQAGRSNTEDEDKERNEEEQDIVSKKKLQEQLSACYFCVKDRGNYNIKYLKMADGEMGRLEKMIVSIFESGYSQEKPNPSYFEFSTGIDVLFIAWRIG